MQELDTLPVETLSPLLQEGLAHHAGGHLAQAASKYQRAYNEDPEDADALVLLGIVARQGGQFEAAIKLIELAIERKPDSHVYLNLALACLGAGDLGRARAACRVALNHNERSGKAWALLGDIELQNRNPKEAVAAYGRALRLPSGVARAAQALGNQLCREQRYQEALGIYARGIAAEPGNADLHFTMGAAAAAAGKVEEARSSYLKALQYRPKFPEAHLNLGNLLYDARHFAAAAAAYSRAIALRPEYAKAYCNLGNALSEMGEHTKAIACYERALALDEGAVAARHNLGNALLHSREYDRAEKCFREVLNAEPGRAAHHNSLGNVLLRQHRDAEAEASYNRAVALEPGYAAAHINLANALLQLGRVEEMKQHYRRGVELDPASAGGQYNLGLVLLRDGDYLEGWLKHEWRWDFRELQQPRRHFSQPQWRGEPLNGAIILLHAEQGLGDTLQFIRYAPLVAARGGRVFLEVQPRLRRLLEGMSGVERVIVRGDTLPEFAWHSPLMSLPLAFRTTVDTIPVATPYLRADPALVAAAWQVCPPIDKRLRVGLAWAGNPSNKGDAQRSMALEQLAPLADVPNAIFYSLQLGAAAEQIQPLQDRFPLIDACSRDKDFAETAAVAATLDLVISVDTSTAHLAGAMGLPLWVMLPHLADWRWMEEREDNPWYPTARLFRQPARGDWVSVVQALCAALHMERATEKPGCSD